MVKTLRKSILAVVGMLLVMTLVGASSMVLADPGTVNAVNTTAIDDMADTIVALLIALIPVLLILAIWTKMKGIWAVLPFSVLAVNTTGITEMADTIIALLIALIPVLLILAIWTKMKHIW